MNYKLGSILIILLGSWGLLISQDRAFLGIEYDKLSKTKQEALDIGEVNGSYVTRVLPNSTADRAGIQPMDYLYGIDDERTSWSKDFGDLLSRYRAGDRVTLHYYRKSRRQTTQARFIGRSQIESYEEEEGEKAFLGVSPHSRNNGDELGMRVTVVRNSTAQVMGLRDGDVILSLNGYPIANWVDISLAMSLFRPGETIAVELEREGRRQTFKSILLNEEEREALSNCDDCGKEKAYLGFYSESLSREKVDRLGFENPYGVYVTKVIPGTAADRHGIMPFDYLYGVDEYRVGKEQSITNIFSKYYAGEKATLYLVRRGDNKKLPVTFGRRGEGERAPAADDPCQKPFLGVQQAYGQNDQGVQVNPVSNSTAEALGMEDGDIITSINGYPMIDWGDITSALSMLKPGDLIEVTWLHHDTEYRKQRPIKSTCETRNGSRGGGGDRVRVRPAPAPEPEYRFSEQSIRGMNTNLRTLSEEEVEKINQVLKLELAENGSLEVDKFSLISNSEEGEYRIRFSLPERGETRLRMFNDSGRIVYAYDLGSFAGDFSDRVNLLSNGPGRYFLEISQDEQSRVYEIEVSFR